MQTMQKDADHAKGSLPPAEEPGREWLDWDEADERLGTGCAKSHKTHGPKYFAGCGVLEHRQVLNAFGLYVEHFRPIEGHTWESVAALVLLTLGE